MLRTSAATVSEGMLANTADTGSLEYNTVDGTLWFVHALGRHVSVTGDDDLGRRARPRCSSRSCEHHSTGTRFGIGVDPADGLLRQGAEGWALTWMDARIDGVPDHAARRQAGRGERAVDRARSTSRRGSCARARTAPAAVPALARPARRASFVARFVRPDGGGLFDVVDGPGGDDASVRPNQLLAVSLPGGPLDGADDTARAVVEVCRPVAAHAARPPLARSRRPALPAAPPRHAGRARRRLPPGHGLAVADRPLRRCGPCAPASRSTGVLAGLEAHLGEWGLGSVSETADGAAPHVATGCPFQAWSVAEVLRVRREATAAAGA